MDKLSFCTFEMQEDYKVNKLSAVGGQTVFWYKAHMAYYLNKFGNANGPFHYVGYIWTTSMWRFITVKV